MDAQQKSNETPMKTHKIYCAQARLRFSKIARGKAQLEGFCVCLRNMQTTSATHLKHRVDPDRVDLRLLLRLCALAPLPMLHPPRSVLKLADGLPAWTEYCLAGSHTQQGRHGRTRL